MRPEAGGPREPDSALLFARYLEGYVKHWNHNFPGLWRRAHWHITHTLCLNEKGGVTFAAIRGELDSVYGMAEEAVRRRLDEFKDAKLIHGPDKLNARSTLHPANRLMILFNGQNVSSINALAQHQLASHHWRKTLLHRQNQSSNKHEILPVSPRFWSALALCDKFSPRKARSRCRRPTRLPNTS
jgi:hypothetical protein